MSPEQGLFLFIKGKGVKREMNHEYVKNGRCWVRNYILMHGGDRSPSMELFHHGVKGQKWGVRHGPPYPLDRSKESVEKSAKSGIVKKTVSGHSGNPKTGIPNSISDHIDREGKVDKRAFYDEDGWKAMEIHATDHKNPKWHSYGEHGEHIHYCEWDHETGNKINDVVGEIPIKLRKENKDIL